MLDAQAGAQNLRCLARHPPCRRDGTGPGSWLLEVDLGLHVRVPHPAWDARPGEAATANSEQV